MPIKNEQRFGIEREPYKPDHGKIDKILTEYGRVPAWWVYMVEVKRLIPDLRSRELAEMFKKSVPTIRNAMSNISKKYPKLLQHDPDRKDLPAWVQQRLVQHGVCTLTELRELMDINSFIPSESERRIRNEKMALEEARANPDMLDPSLDRRLRQAMALAERVRNDDMPIGPRDLLLIARTEAARMIADPETPPKLRAEMIQNVMKDTVDMKDNGNSEGGFADVMRKLKERNVTDTDVDDTVQRKESTAENREKS